MHRATGSVGQRFVQLLDGHPWFRVVALTGADHRAGRAYGETCHWIFPEPMPTWAARLPVLPSSPEAVDCPLVFSALPADIARQVEPKFAHHGSLVCTNASAFRREPDVPVLLPEVNPEHASLVDVQRERHNWRGAIVANPNCTSTGMTVALKPLQDAFGLRRIFAVSLQALSGAGYPGVASLDVIDNVLPYVEGEEAKLEWEPRKMLGKLNGDTVSLGDFAVSAQANRVPVSDGHLVCLTVELREPAGVEAAHQALAAYHPPEISCDLPSAPHPAILVRDEQDRPQPRLDRLAGGGMTTVVGRLRPDPLFDFKMVVLSHNTVRGAAGGSIYNAELLVKLGLVAGA
ncbi:MAG: aspartate-semialdehyde dehydrogenase [Chloroflexi bacterium]|nr:aspartate-semialdehyde dehydrogenase [Chloroflexota bacterium]